ncbi:MAG: hypothetical protein ACO2PN_11300 [Pyrobaculum sp.]|jgi:hypothetical protein
MQTEPKRAVVRSDIKNGMLASVGVVTDPLEFSYSYYEFEKVASLYISRRFDDKHRRTVMAYVPPEIAQRVIETFFTSKTDSETEETWKHIYAIVETITANIVEVATVKVGNDLTLKARGVSVSFGYRKWESDKYYVYADAEWRGEEHYSCHVYEGNYHVDAKDIRQALIYFVRNVLDLVQICKT